MVEHLTEAVCCWLPDTTLTYVNGGYCSLLAKPREELLGQKFISFLPDSTRRAFMEYLDSLVTDPRVWTITHEVLAGDGSIRWLEWTDCPVFGEEGRLIEFQSVGRDVTERKWAEEALRDSEEKFRDLVENTTDLVWQVDPDGVYRYMSPQSWTVLGYKPEEMVGKTPFELMTPDEAERVAELFFKIVSERGRLVMFENTLLHKAGHPVVFETRATSSFDDSGAFVGYVGTCRDVTERRRAEDALRSSHEQLRALAARLQAAREEERARLARRIHDDLGHALTALKMDIFWLAKTLSASAGRPRAAPIQERLLAMSSLLDQTIESVRETASELRPGVLDDFGLSAALEWQTRQFEGRTGIHTTFAGGTSDVPIGHEQSTVVYRICQELLTNVARHADATAVRVALGKQASQLVLEVSDNGKGITQEQASSLEALGILGMRERAALLGGEFKIAGAPGKGTQAIVRVPLAPGPQAGGE